jgi:hypothetical protein
MAAARPCGFQKNVNSQPLKSVYASRETTSFSLPGRPTGPRISLQTAWRRMNSCKELRTFPFKTDEALRCFEATC